MSPPCPRPSVLYLPLERVLLMRAPVSYPSSSFLLSQKTSSANCARGRSVRDRTRSEVYCGVEEYHLWKEKEGRGLCRETARVQCCPDCISPGRSSGAKLAHWESLTIELNICLAEFGSWLPLRRTWPQLPLLLYPRLRVTPSKWPWLENCNRSRRYVCRQPASCMPYSLSRKSVLEGESRQHLSIPTVKIINTHS